MNKIGFGQYSRDCIEVFNDLRIKDDMKEKIEAASPDVFTPVGTVALMGEEVFAGIKKRSSHRAIEKVAREWHLADQLLAVFPHRFSDLPLFSYPVIRNSISRYNGVGVFTEDFTEKGSKSLFEQKITSGWYPRDEHDVPVGLLREIYSSLEGRAYSEALSHAIGSVDGRELLIDFDDIAYPSEKELDNYKEIVNTVVIRI